MRHEDIGFKNAALIAQKNFRNYMQASALPLFISFKTTSATSSAVSTPGAGFPSARLCAGLPPMAFISKRVAVILGCITLTVIPSNTYMDTNFGDKSFPAWKFPQGDLAYI